MVVLLDPQRGVSRECPQARFAPVREPLAARLVVVNQPDFAKQYLISKGFEPIGAASEAFAEFIVVDQAKGKRLVDISGVKLEQ